MDAKKWIGVVLLLVVAFVAYNRNRLYLRDPLGSVTRNGVKEAGAQVYINYSNDTMIENDNPPMYVLLVQHNNHAGSPVQLHCLRWMVCIMDSDSATLLRTQTPIAVEEMTSKSVHFIDGDKRDTVVALH